MSRVFKKVPNGVAERKVRDQCILVPISSNLAQLNSLYELNETSAFVWERASTGLAESVIVEALVEAYDVASDQAAASVSRTLDELAELGALVEVEA